VNENGSVEVSLPRGPLNSGFNISRLRRPRVPRGNAAVGQPRSEVLDTRELARAINNSRVARWQHARRGWPASDVERVVNLRVGRFSASKPPEHRENANEVDVRAENYERKKREGSVGGFSKKHGKVD